MAEVFFVIGDAVLFDQGDEIGGRVTRQGRFGEVRILREEVFRRAMKIREIAAASAGNEDFFADFFGAFKDDDAASAFADFDSAEEPGGATTEDYRVEVGQVIAFRRMGDTDAVMLSLPVMRLLSD